ncbi:MAG: hypothetical protein M3Q82_02320 [Actinomycetota bacterium]|jgi:hypothetical protein|nr:hypothetical protein [Actinomycetota bacterium]
MLGALVVGIIGMHGLAACRTAVAGHHGAQLVAAVAPVAGPIEFAHADVATFGGARSAASRALPGATPGDQHAPREVTGACVAALLGLAGMLLLMLPARGGASWPVPRVSCRSAVLAVTSRALDIPSPKRLTILRC